MTTLSSIWLLNKLCLRKSYSFTSSGMVIAWMSSSSCPTKSIKYIQYHPTGAGIPQHIDPDSCFGKLITSPTPLRLPSWWNFLAQQNIPQWKCSQIEDEWEVPPSYLHCWFRYSDTRWNSSMVDSIGIPLHPNSLCVTGKKLILYSMMTITLELAYRSVLLHDQEGIVTHSDV